MKKTVLIIDDSPFTRKTLREMIEDDGEFAVVDTAVNGREGLKKTLLLKPDLVILDLEMPEMDGFTYLRFLMAQQPTPTLVVSSQTSSETVFRALELGAVDFIPKPTALASMKLLDIKRQLLFKMRSTQVARLAAIPVMQPVETVEITRPATQDLALVGIGASTGGPQALQSILTTLPGGINAAVLIAQHMPEGFTKVFAERLNRLSPLSIKEASDGDHIEAGAGYICPGGCHMGVVRARGSLQLSVVPKKPNDLYVPSVDYLFRSLVPFASRTLAIVLTGMGSDGRAGSLALKAAGAPVWAETEETAVVYGMPKEVINSGAASFTSPLGGFSEAIIRHLDNLS